MWVCKRYNFYVLHNMINFTNWIIICYCCVLLWQLIYYSIN